MILSIRFTLYTVTSDTRISGLLIKAGVVDDTVDLTAINLAASVQFDGFGCRGSNDNF